MKEESYYHIKKAIVTLYNGNEEKVNMLTGGFQNEVFEFHDGRKERILRLTNSGNRTVSSIQSELDFIESLASEGIAVSRPILSVYGNSIEEIKLQNETFYLTTFFQAPGRLVNVSNPNQWNCDFFKKWGMTLGKMHSLARNNHDIFSTYKRPDWRAGEKATSSFLASISAKVISAYEKIMNNIAKLPQDRNTFGLIHNDFHQGNFFVLDGQMSIFDFDDCAFSWFAQDIAVAYYHAVWHDESFNPDRKDFPSEFIKFFFEGYSQVNVLSKEILEQVPLFLKLRETFLLTLFHKKWDLQNLQEWQAYTLRNLKDRIENEIPYTDVQFQSL